MISLNKSKIFFITALSVACYHSARAADLVISEPVIIDSGFENDRLLINDDIKATGNSQAALEINGSLSGILIFPDRSIQTNAGLYNGSAFTPESAAINITQSGQLTDTLDNNGYIRNGINLEGNIHTTSGSAVNVQGTSQTEKSVILESITLQNNGYIWAENDHAMQIDQHGFIDVISIQTGSSIRSSGAGSSAIYIAESGQIGGLLGQEISVDDSLYYSGSDATPIINIQGKLSSDNGSGIKIDGAAHGAIVVSRGEITATNATDEAGIRVNGNYYGTVKNYRGIINNGIVISGGHSAATNAAPPSSVAAINEGDQSAYISAGVAAEYAELRGGYHVLSDGIAQAYDNHAIYLNEYSKADLISIEGTLSTVANNKSAIYVAENAELGDDASQSAIEVTSGGNITSLEGSAIDIDGTINGWVTISGGSISTASTDSTNNYAVDFRDAESRLQFIQVQDTSLTQGKIAGSTLSNDYMAVEAGTINSKAISNIEHIKVSGGSVMADTITGLEHLEVSTHASVHIAGDFTAPETTTVKVMNGYNRDSAVITVDQSLSAESEGSQFTLHPKSAAAFHDMVEKKYVTVIDYNPALTGNLSNDFSATTNKDFIREDSILFNVSQEFTDDGHYKIHIKPKAINDIVDDLDATEQEEELLTNAILAATSKDSKNLDKQAAMLDSLTEDNVQTLVDGLEPVNPTDRQGLTAVQQIVHQRLQLVTGLGFGDNYFDYDGDAFYEDIYNSHHGISSGFSFMNGAGWGQFIYGNSRHDKIEGSNGFTGTMSGFILGADTELTNTFRLGVAGSWTRNKIKGDNYSASTVNNYMATFYNHWYSDGWYTDAIFSAGKGKSDTSQLLLSKQVTGSYNSNTFGMRLITGRKFGYGAIDISPQIELHYGHMTFDAYEEKGNTGFEKKIDIKDYQIMEFGFGFRLALPTEYGYSIRPEISMMGYYDAKRSGTEVEATYLAGGDSFIVTGPSRDQLRLQSGMALSIDFMERWTLDATYNINWSKNFLSNNFSAKARYEF
ncbi:MAG: autotransporter outer membrane beta-barrel domain-containing protein [Endozoicomonas sp. (ex Botrylloides leachii)]|nr:autotransporter outer membrane beta-barrel domain-containing protein [Endozoicomonas sp. (ex Botrylloides leachii)]